MGGRNQDAANASWKEISKSGSNQAPTKDQKSQKCKKTPKHWIGVRVEDEDGKLVKDVTLHAQMEDGEYSLDTATAALDGDGVCKTGKIFDSTECTFSFPDVYDVDWWLKGGTKPATFPAEQSCQLADGDCVVSAAATAGLRDYHELWDCAANSSVKTNYPNPNQQAVGNTYQGPNKKTKTEKKAIDQTWTFVVRNKKPAKIRIVLLDKDDKPLKDKGWVFSKVAKSGKTGADGLIEVTGVRPAELKADKLKVEMQAGTTAPAAPTRPAVTDPPAYPPPIFEPDFKDAIPTADYTGREVTWELNIGSLTAFNLHAGALQRLQNLGFGCAADPGTNPTAEGEPEAIKTYYRFYQPTADPSGKTWTDIKDDLRDRHDKA